MENSLIFFKSYHEAITNLDENIRGRIYETVLNYAFYGEEPEKLTNGEWAVFTLIKDSIDNQKKRKEMWKK